MTQPMPKPDNVSFTEVVKQVARKTSIQQKICKAVIEGFEDVIVENISKGKRVVVRSFGAFYCRDRKPGVGRNIKDGGTAVISYKAKRQLAFKAIDQFMDM